MHPEDGIDHSAHVHEVLGEGHFALSFGLSYIKRPITNGRD